MTLTRSGFTELGLWIRTHSSVNNSDRVFFSACQRADVKEVKQSTKWSTGNQIRPHGRRIKTSVHEINETPTKEPSCPTPRPRLVQLVSRQQRKKRKNLFQRIGRLACYRVFSLEKKNKLDLQLRWAHPGVQRMTLAGVCRLTLLVTPSEGTRKTKQRTERTKRTEQKEGAND